jgi:hypothetical protein
MLYSWKASREEEEEVFNNGFPLVAFGAGKWPPTPALLLLLLLSCSPLFQKKKNKP